MKKKKIGILIICIFFLLVPVNLTSNLVATKTTMFQSTINEIIYPPDAPIKHNGNMYYLHGNVKGSIVIKRDNIIIDGKGWVVQGDGTGIGIDISSKTNVTIQNIQINGFLIGIRLNNSSFCKIVENNISLNFDWAGIYLVNSPNNMIKRNNIDNNWDGIQLDQQSSCNIIQQNTITNNRNGISVPFLSENNVISENKLKNNTNYGIGLFGYMNSPANITITKNQIERSKIGITIALASTNMIEENSIINNEIGILLSGSSKNIIHHNNITMNEKNILLEPYTSRYGEYIYSQNNLFENNHQSPTN